MERRRVGPRYRLFLWRRQLRDPPIGNAIGAVDRVEPARRFARTPKSDTSAPDTPPASPSNPAETPAPIATAPKPESKIARVLALLGRAEGATLDELVAETGWLPHTTRAALTGLKKKGHAIERSKRDERTCYRLGAEA